jgi:hypothetical protein
VSLAELVVTGMRTVDGERFLVGRRVKGRITGEGGTEEEHSFPPELSSDTRAALEAVGITPYVPIPEAALREKLARLGISKPEIDSHFAEARKWMSHISTVWPPQH